MMIQRKSSERGYFDHGWLKTFHTFSFSDYFDKNWMGFSKLRVINEDWIVGGAGFPTHGHKDMEILTYVLEGCVAHQDNTGGDGSINPGEVQLMTAGKGIRHSEFNALKDQKTHLYQIWIMPNKDGHVPTYRQKDFTDKLNQEGPVLLASPNADNGSLGLHQDAYVYARRTSKNVEWKIEDTANSEVWIQVCKGSIEVSSQQFIEGDGVGLIDEKNITINLKPHSEILVFNFFKSTN